MLQAKLPQSLSTEAINAFTFLRNSPTKSLGNKIPHEIWRKTIRRISMNQWKQGNRIK